MYLEYVDSVLSGKLPACGLVKQACSRFLSDLKREDILFKIEFYEHARNFIENLEHTTGEKGKSKFILEPWQHFIIANIFGFIRLDGTRRFTRVYVELPRKNGKSTLANAIMLYGLLVDNEEGAQVYSAATKLDQAMMVFGEGARVCNQVNGIKEAVKVYNSVNNRLIQFGTSIYRPLEWNPHKQDGLNTHFCCIDEYHAHSTDELYNVIRNSMGARRQPLLFTITTAGFKKESPCFRHRKYCLNVLKGSIKDDSIFAVIYTLDEKDDWKNPESWVKANPNWGVSVKPRILEEGLMEAKESPHKEVEFKTKLLNVWTDSAKTWINDSKWISCGTDADLAVGECFGGLDLASVSDFCAYSIFWPETKYVKTWYWIPEDSLSKRSDQSGESIRGWAMKGILDTTPGNVTDYDYIRAKINELAELYGMPKDIAFDPHNSSQLVIQLQDDGFKMFKFRQGFLSMSQPTKELERFVLSNELKHDSNPICRWMMSNVMIIKDPAGNIKIDKEKSQDKVDGPVSKVMAIGTWMDENLNKNEPAEFFVQTL